MKEKIKMVNLRPVDGYTPKINKVTDTRELFEVELELEETPDNIWATMFKDEMIKNLPPDYLQNSRRDPHLKDKSIIFFTTINQIETDGKQIANLVDAVNEQVKQENIKIKEENQKEKGEKEEDEAIKRRMHDKLKKII